MLIEVKAKVAWRIDGKVKKKIETYILDKEVFAEAEYEVLSLLNQDKNTGEVEDFEITSLKLSIVKEIITQYTGDHTFIATLRDTTLLDDDSEKIIKYRSFYGLIILQKLWLIPERLLSKVMICR